MNIKPIFDNILIEAKKVEDKTESGILLPSTAEKDKPEEGTVLAVGDGLQTKEGKIIPMKIKVGDRVLFTKYGVTEINVDGQDYLMAKQPEILAIIG